LKVYNISPGSRFFTIQLEPISVELEKREKRYFVECIRLALAFL